MVEEDVCGVDVVVDNGWGGSVECVNGFGDVDCEFYLYWLV